MRNVSITIDTFQGPLRVIRNQDISLQPGEILGIVVNPAVVNQC